jgi:hypothetical protein
VPTAGGAAVVVEPAATGAPEAGQPSEVGAAVQRDFDGSLDGFRVDGTTVTAYGWATGIPGQYTGMARAEIQIRLIQDDDVIAWEPTGVARPDVQAVHPEYGPTTGFEVSFALPRDVHMVCVSVYFELKTIMPETLACARVRVTTSAVLGNLDSVTAHQGGASIQGWALQSAELETSTVHAYVDGVWAGAFPARSERWDVAAVHPESGPHHGFAADLTTSEGPHEVCVYGISRYSDEPNPLLGCRGVEVPRQTPLGTVDTLTAFLDTARIRGWAVDPDSDAPIEVHLYRDGGWAGSLVADDDRPDVAAALGLADGAHGFDAGVELPLGRHTFCAYAINTGPGLTNPLLGCRDVGVPLGEPFGSFDEADVSISGLVWIRGWVVDPDSRGPATVHVSVDGRGIAGVVADQDRSDVGVAYPTLGNKHGFWTTVRVPPGSRSLCIYAINTGVGTTNPLLGCRPVG